MFAKPIKILNLDLSRNEVIVTNDDTRKLEDGDRICFYRRNIEIACGLVVSTSPFDSTVKLTSPGESLRAAKTEKDSASESYVELVFEKVELERSDRAEFKGSIEKTPTDLTNKTLLEGLVQLRRSVASSRDNLYGKEDLLKEVETKVLAYDDSYNHRLLSNVSAGFNYIFPTVSYQQAVWDNLVLAINPILINTPGGSGTVSGYGMYLTMNHYGLEAFHGDWLQFGVGFMKLNSAGVDWTTPAVIGTAGWRWFWDDGLNFGLGLGAQYLLTSTPATANIDFPGILPCLILDLGFAF